MPTARIRQTHTGLLVNAYRRRLPRSPDAIIVPSRRSASHIATAAGLARAMGCPLLVLSSQLSKASEVAQVMRGVSGLAISIQPGPLNGWLRLRTLTGDPRRHRSYVDRSVKRNAGLLIARMMRWSRVLFLDDDITNLDAAAVRGAVQHIGWRGPKIVGWRARHYPDNSVVCHALRAVGVNQGVFIAGSALLVHVGAYVSFFPAVYNEDWLFMLDALPERRVAWASDVTQAPYQPFATPERAEREELGDVLAEGLVALVHEGRSLMVACFPSYWHDVIAERAAMLRYIERQLWIMHDRGQARTSEDDDVTQVMASVLAAQKVLARITAEELAEYTSLWRRDLSIWRRRWRQLPRYHRVEDALDFLGLTDVHRAAP